MADVENIILNVAYVLNRIIPKKKNQVFFYSLPDYSDNARSIYESLEKNCGKEFRIIWSVRDIKKYKDILSKCIVVKHKSLRSLWEYCRSKYIIRTHSLWGNKYVINKQIMCIAWHGMPLKREYDPSKEIKKVNCDILTSTGDHFSNELALAMGLDRSKCKETGLPRNDDLFKKSEVLTRLGYNGFKKTIIWMPTYRASSFRNDGIENDIGIPTVPAGGLEKLNEVLKNKGYLLILKLHPFAADKIKNISLSNIKCLRNEDIPQESTLYEIIGQTDALITDYSSISVDYVLIDKPMAFVIDDIEEYRKTRGFSIEPIEDYMPGNKIKSFDELVQWFVDFDGSDGFSKQREIARKLFHKYSDQYSSNRVLKEIGLL